MSFFISIDGQGQTSTSGADACWPMSAQVAHAISLSWLQHYPGVPKILIFLHHSRVLHLLWGMMVLNRVVQPGPPWPSWGTGGHKGARVLITKLGLRQVPMQRKLPFHLLLRTFAGLHEPFLGQSAPRILIHFVFTPQDIPENDPPPHPTHSPSVRVSSACHHEKCGLGSAVGLQIVGTCWLWDVLLWSFRSFWDCQRAVDHFARALCMWRVIMIHAQQKHVEGSQAIWRAAGANWQNWGDMGEQLDRRLGPWKGVGWPRSFQCIP